MLFPNYNDFRLKTLYKKKKKIDNLISMNGYINYL